MPLLPRRTSPHVALQVAASIAALLLFFPLAAHAADEDLIDADRPGIADGSKTLKRAHFQIEIGFDREDRSDDQTLKFPLLLRYGISDRFEFRVESDTHVREKIAHATSTGWDPVSAGFKYHLVDQQEISLGVIGGWFPPSGSGEFRSDHSSGDVRLAADLEFGDHWSINPNLGVQRDESSATSGTGALTLQYNITKKSNVFVDGGVQRGEVLLDAGAAWILSSDVQFDASVGRGAHGSNTPKLFWGAGVSRRF